ncbi:N-acetyltransferase [Paenibacillus sp. FSL H7-0331]|uniref:GNAT family N-acetyltransferase n=1 Tax=Paenibacillus sp. FSL H7-0331 TaxID=1920421 RepID=UPI00096F4202|nr:GNAT family N-acetyltransferase [Paenibacillus sp. FSL H7-0331]OMF10736.1 hypothetical protein BK127_26385 [Paenibacillus sp. FSL H7-0331]
MGIAEITALQVEDLKAVKSLYTSVTRNLRKSGNYQWDWIYGLGSKLLRFAEVYIASYGYTSIRLDVYAENAAALGMYQRGGYSERGNVRYPFRKVPYFCFEKVLNK